MKNSILPIFHFAQLRGFALAHNAPAEIIDSLECLYTSAVKGEAVEATREEKAGLQAETGKENINDNISSLKVGNEITQNPDTHGAENDTGAQETIAARADYTLGDNARSIIGEEEPALGIIDQEANSPAVSVDLSLEEAAKRFPHFTAAIEVGEDGIVPEREDEEEKPLETAIPSGDVPEREENGLPACIKPNSSWPVESLLIMLKGRAATPPLSWERIGAKVGKSGGNCSVKYSTMKAAGQVDAFIAMQADEAELPLLVPPVLSQPAQPGNNPLTAFAKFYEKFPRQRRGNRDKTYRAYLRALDRATAEEIQTGLDAYAISDEVAKGFAKGAEAWLNDDRWTVFYPPAKFMTVPADKLISDHNTYAGKRDPGQPLVAEDWPQIDILMNKKRMSVSDIAKSYNVDFWEMRQFIDNQQAQAAHG